MQVAEETRVLACTQLCRRPMEGSRHRAYKLEVRGNAKKASKHTHRHTHAGAHRHPHAYIHTRISTRVLLPSGASRTG